MINAYQKKKRIKAYANDYQVGMQQHEEKIATDHLYSS